MGALACTSYCVYQGQDPWTAMQITVAATVAGLVSVSFSSYVLLCCASRLEHSCPAKCCMARCPSGEWRDPVSTV